MAISIKVRYTADKEQRGLAGYRMRVEVVRAVEMPDAIFVMQYNVPAVQNADANGKPDTFERIADVFGLAAYPVDTPDLPKNIPYYRTNKVDLVFPSWVDLVDTRQLMESAIARLVNTLKAQASSVSDEVTYA